MTQGYFEIATRERAVHLRWNGPRFVWWASNHEDVAFSGEQQAINLEKGTPPLHIKYTNIEKITFELFAAQDGVIPACLWLHLGAGRTEKILFRARGFTDAAAHLRLLLQIAKTSSNAPTQEIFREAQEQLEWGFYRLERSEHSITLCLTRSSADAIPVPLEESEALEAEVNAAHQKLTALAPQGFMMIRAWSAPRMNTLYAWLGITFALYFFRAIQAGTLSLLALYLTAVAQQGQFLSRAGIPRAVRDLSALYALSKIGVFIFFLMGMPDVLSVLPYVLEDALFPGLLHLGALFFFWRESLRQLPCRHRDLVGASLSVVMVVLTAAALLSRLLLGF